MMRVDSFGRSLVFAALAAAGLPVAVTFGGAVFGAESAARLYAIAAAGLYAIGQGGRRSRPTRSEPQASEGGPLHELGPDRSRRFGALAFAAFAGVILALLPLDLRATAVGAAGIVALVRAVLLAEGHTLRALAIEAVFGAAGLAAAAHFARGGMFATSLAIWGYFLVQSGWFLIGNRGAGAGEIARDPFDRARAQLLRLLEDDPV